MSEAEHVTFFSQMRPAEFLGKSRLSFNGDCTCSETRTVNYHDYGVMARPARYSPNEAYCGNGASQPSANMERGTQFHAHIIFFEL